jgi:predicted small lipoprotein YifL
MKIAGALLLCISMVLAGCGLKGPLYLPDKPGEVVTRGPRSDQAPAEQGTEPPPAAEPSNGPDMPEPPKQP